MKKIISLFSFLSLFGYMMSNAQSIGLFTGENNGMKLKIESDTTASLSYHYETTLSFFYDCRIIKKSDSTFQLENLRKTKDGILLKKGKIKGGCILFINFYVINRAGQRTAANINYEIVNSQISVNKKERYICFIYNHRFYCYAVNNNFKEVDIFIDADNSFLINNWKIRGDKLIPYIQGKEANSWTLKRS